MLIEIDILGKNSDNLLVEEEKKKEPSQPKKLEGFPVYELPQLEIVIIE
jgi:hypothetical protein